MQPKTNYKCLRAQTMSVTIYLNKRRSFVYSDICFNKNFSFALIYSLKELKFISDRMRDEDNDGSYEDEWKYAALVLDR